MAAPLSAIPGRQTCEICMEDDKPFMMSQSCGHLLCEKCHHRLRLGEEMSLRCPFCRKTLENKAEIVYKGEISCHICRKLKDCEEIWWCGECRSFLCSKCQVKKHGVSNKIHKIEEFAGNGKAQAAIVATGYLKLRARASYQEDQRNYTLQFGSLLSPVTNKIAEDKANAQMKQLLSLCDDLGQAFGSNKMKHPDQNVLPSDEILFEQLSKLACLNIGLAPVSLPSKYFVAAEVDTSTIKILVESLEVSYFSILGDYFIVVKENKIFVGKVPRIIKSAVKIPALKLLYELKDQPGDSDIFGTSKSFSHRSALSIYAENRFTCISLAMLSRIKAKCCNNDRWLVTFSDIKDPQSTIQQENDSSKELDLTDIVPTDNTLGKVTEMKIFAARHVNHTYYDSEQIFYIVANCENGSEILELKYDVVSGWEEDSPFRSIHRAGDKIQSFAALQDGDSNKLLYMALVFSGAEEKVITFEAKESGSIESFIETDNAPFRMDTGSFTFPSRIMSLDFATQCQKFRLLIRTEDGDVYFMLDSKEPSTKPQKRLSISENSKISAVNTARYMVLDEDTGTMRSVLLM